jgi:hypothetical protein
LVGRGASLECPLSYSLSDSFIAASLSFFLVLLFISLFWARGRLLAVPCGCAQLEGRCSYLAGFALPSVRVLFSAILVVSPAFIP